MPRDRADDLFVEGPLGGAERRQVVEDCQRLAAEIAEYDRQAQELVRKRREALSVLRSQRRRLWVARIRAGRQPPPEGGMALPPVPAGATWLYGRRLRLACRALLKQAGSALSLVELHVLLHRHSLGVAGPHPAKVLADALGYDVDGGRCRRIRRGVYELDPGQVAKIPRQLWPDGPIIGPLVPG